ncbi:lipid II-degrading bacteriocin [Pseudomonas corrugata]|uniref:Lipid II-degrading bacteriocin n=1 Tax=Pseudomonas corrugata TaxID=47879 RepID=A0A7Y5Z9A6_9PSED|nr:lipid II-degrading bacteriocin [Pseudomonas corrugata]NUT89206.1 lipid II-degrading bacteriocin [Pseudomonas corrugata]
MNIELPPTFIYPDDFGTSRGSGRGLPNPAPMAMIGKMIQQRNMAYERGHWPQMLQRHLKAMRNNSPVRYGLDGIIIGELKVAHGADLVMLRNSTLSTADAWNLGIKDGAKIQSTEQLAIEQEFSGGVFTPFKAFGHWLLGKGKPVSVRLERIGISPTPNKIPDLMAIINAAGVGNTTVNLKVPYSTAQDSNVARIYLGNITLQITGDVTRYTSGTLKFAGKIKAFSDRYDANASSHRAAFDEHATRALREVGRVANARDYEIRITGELPINFSR